MVLTTSVLVYGSNMGPGSLTEEETREVGKTGEDGGRFTVFTTEPKKE